MQQLKPKKVLVVEDNEDGREGMAILLKMEGFQVSSVGDGRQGLKLASTYTPDLIITDIIMPNLDGIEMIKSIRQLPGFASTPILVITAHGEAKAGDALRAGATRMMTKPVDVKEFLLTINTLLG